MFKSKTIYCLFIKRTSPKSSIQKIEIRHITGTGMVKKLGIKFNNINFLQRVSRKWGSGACSQEKFVRAAPSRKLESVLLKNRSKVAPTTDPCTEEEILTE